MRFHNLALSLFLYTTLSAAWPWPPTVQNVNNALARRQDDDSSSKSSAQPSKSSAQPSKTAAATTTENTKSSGAEETKKTTGSAAESTTASKSSNGKGSKTTGKSTKTQSINPVDSPGGISMIEPKQTSTTYIKIGEEVTFKWNYTGIQSSPTKLDVIATNTEGVTWTIAQNMSMEATGSVVWDTGDATPSLGMEQYHFVVYDAVAGPTPTGILAGKLNPISNQYQFALYSPRAAQGTGKTFCVTCSAGVTTAERQSVKVLMLVATLTVLSFSWFASGFLGV